MSDPLSVAAQVSTALHNVIDNSRHLPDECRKIRREVDDIRNVLAQLQVFITGVSRASASRTSLIMVDQVVVTLAACVTTFSELDAFVEGLLSDSEMHILDRLRWASKEKEIKSIIMRLESHKSTLTLMLTILTCIESIHSHEAQEHEPASLEDEQPRWRRDERCFAFEELLMNSRVYANAGRNNSDAFSIISSAGRTATWSMLSGLSLSEISHLAILAIPIYSTDPNNKEVYNFDPAITGSLLEGIDGNPTSLSKVESTGKTSTRLRWMGKMTRILQGRQSQLLSEETTPSPIFGVSIRQSMAFANVQISLVDNEGNPYIYGYLPIIVAKVGVFLKEEGGYKSPLRLQSAELKIGLGTEIEDIFAPSGNPVRVLELQNIFSTPPRYGKNLHWADSCYTVHDAASLLLRYLKTLSEPVIPYSLYEDFVTQLGPPANNESSNIGSIATSIRDSLFIKLHPLNRHLLLYLLDLLAVFCSIVKSNVNKMTAPRIVGCFQPAILSGRLDTMDADAHALAAKIVVLLIENQDYFLDGSLPGSSGNNIVGS